MAFQVVRTLFRSLTLGVLCGWLFLRVEAEQAALKSNLYESGLVFLWSRSACGRRIR